MKYVTTYTVTQNGVEYGNFRSIEDAVAWATSNLKDSDGPFEVDDDFYPVA